MSLADCSEFFDCADITDVSDDNSTTNNTDDPSITPKFGSPVVSMSYTIDLSNRHTLPIDLDPLPNILDRYGVAIVRIETCYTAKQVVSAIISTYESSYVFTDLKNGDLLSAASSFAESVSDVVLFVTILPVDNIVGYDRIGSVFWEHICHDWPHNLKIVIIAHKDQGESL